MLRFAACASRPPAREGPAGVPGVARHRPEACDGPLRGPKDAARSLPPQGSRQPGAQSQPQDPITTRQTPDYTRLCRGLAGCLCGRRRVSIKYRLDPNLTLFRDDVGRPFGVYPSLTSACGNPLERLVWRTWPTSTAAPRGLSWQSRNYFRCCISTGLPVPRTTGSGCLRGFRRLSASCRPGIRGRRPAEAKHPWTHPWLATGGE